MFAKHSDTQRSRIASFAPVGNRRFTDRRVTNPPQVANLPHKRVFGEAQ